MTPTQFSIILNRLDSFEKGMNERAQAIEDRVRKSEVRVAMLFAGIALLAFLAQNGLLSVPLGDA